MKRLGLFLLTIPYFATGMNLGLGKIKAMFQQKAFTISYLDFDSNAFVLQNKAFKHTHELNVELDFSTMHYFEAKMRELQGNGSQYLQAIKQAIHNQIISLGDSNTQLPIMENHIQLIDKVLSGPDMKKIDDYLAIKTLVQEGKITQATSLLDAYKRTYGETASWTELSAYIPRGTQGDVPQSQSVSTYQNKDMKVGEVPQNQLGEKFSHIIYLGNRSSSAQPIYQANNSFGAVPDITSNTGNTSSVCPPAGSSVQNSGSKKQTESYETISEGQLLEQAQNTIASFLKTGDIEGLQAYQNQLKLADGGAGFAKRSIALIEECVAKAKESRVGIGTAHTTDPIKASELELPLNPQNQLISDKSKSYALDTAQDFRSVAKKTLEHCGIVLTGLQNQSSEDVASIKNECLFAINNIKNAKSLEEFSYHLAAVDLRIVIAKHIQEYQSQGSEVDNQFSNRLLEKINQSGQLLGRSIEQFAKRIKYTATHPQEEIYARVMAPIHLAQMGVSVGKIASQYGVQFISAQDKWGFVCQTWSKLADVCSQIKAEDFFDGLGVLAADVITQRGLTKVCRYLSKLEMAVEKVGKGQKLYEHIEKGIDKALQRNPMPIPAQTKIPAADIIRDLRARNIYVPELSERSINTVRALKSHPLYYVIRRTYREINELAPQYEGKYKGFDKCANKFIKFPFKHILAPEFQKREKDFIASLSGWHHDYNNIIENSGLIEVIDKQIGKNGIYQASLKWGQNLVPRKTFFPSNLNRREVLNLIAEAYEDFFSKGATFEMSRNKYQISGITKSGITIKMFIDQSGKIVTAYPEFRKD